MPDHAADPSPGLEPSLRSGKPHAPHPRVARHRAEGVATIKAELSGFNGRLAVAITNGVGTMWCAYAFTILALISLPAAIKGGITSFKVFMAYKGAIMVDDGELYQVMKQAAKLGAVVTVHAENGDMLDHCTRNLLAAGRRDPRYYPASRPVLAEAEATRRAIDYAALVDAEIYIVHLSCAAALEAVSAARRRGVRVWAETRPIYLALTEERYAAGGAEAAKFVGAPPLRTARDQALWQRALAIHRRAIVVDTHNDVTTPMANDDFDLKGTPPAP